MGVGAGVTVQSFLLLQHELTLPETWPFLVAQSLGVALGVQLPFLALLNSLQEAPVVAAAPVLGPLE